VTYCGNLIGVVEEHQLQHPFEGFEYRVRFNSGLVGHWGSSPGRALELARVFYCGRFERQPKTIQTVMINLLHAVCRAESNGAADDVIDALIAGDEAMHRFKFDLVRPPNFALDELPQVVVIES
jgi:hypothetical protein